MECRLPTIKSQDTFQVCTGKCFMLLPLSNNEAASAHAHALCAQRWARVVYPAPPAVFVFVCVCVWLWWWCARVCVCVCVWGGGMIMIHDHAHDRFMIRCLTPKCRETMHMVFRRALEHSTLLIMHACANHMHVGTYPSEPPPSQTCPCPSQNQKGG